MRDPAEAWRRWFGAFFVLVAGGMLVWGLTILKPRLTGVGFLIYWFVCFLFTGLAILIALLDLFITRWRARNARNQLARRALAGLESDPAAPPKRSSAEPREDEQRVDRSVGR